MHWRCKSAFRDEKRFAEVVRPQDLAICLPVGAQDMQEQQHAAILRWGIIAPWDAKKRPVVNARLESITTKPMFQPLLRYRCCVPFAAYYEWQKNADGGKPLKYEITTECTPSYLAAIFSPQNHAFVVLTRESRHDIAYIHHRMPVLLTNDQATAWGDLSVRPSCAIECLQPYQGKLSACAISPETAQPRLF
jgi:putative SOS response-associated peptidase YedK